MSGSQRIMSIATKIARCKTPDSRSNVHQGSSNCRIDRPLTALASRTRQTVSAAQASQASRLEFLIAKLRESTRNKQRNSVDFDQKRSF